MTGTTAPDAETRTGDPGDVAEQLRMLRTEVEQLREEIVRLDGDLDESRRLNLRAAELLDVVYEELGERRTEGKEAS
jgi:hypothetical protein